MALARCETCGRPQGLKQNYSHFHSPDSSRHRVILCGAANCTRRALIWLTDEEEREYRGGERNFRLSSHAIQVKLK